MTSTGKPVWLLDVDGVINAISENPDGAIWPKGRWRHLTARCSGIDWPILAATPVVEFIAATHESGRTEVRWHTTWQHEANALGELLGLPEFAVQDCPEFYPERQLAGGAAPVGVRNTWWKLPAAERVVGEESRPLIWTDDDIDREIGWRGRDRNLRSLGRVLTISPRQHIGLTPKHLRSIDEFIDSLANGEAT
ncbi:hypothetical protein [Micromonospora chalcea]|uniref:hypothetical protein n=1 Tax=Micromonospora chalcea TaxID=1874 RepID=UPI003D73AF3D